MVETATLLFGALLVACAAVVLVMGRRVLAAPKPSEAPREADPGSALVAREVLDEQGQRVGETVRVEGDEVVLKREGGFAMVPRAALRDDGNRLRAEGVDWVAAAVKGEAWRRRHEDTMEYDDKGMPVREPG